MGPHVLGVLADRDTGRRRVCYTTDNRPKVSTRASKTDQIRPQMSQRISLLIHDLKLCQQSKQINKFRETLGVAVATAGSWKSARKFLKASLLLLSCYWNISANYKICTSVTTVRQNIIVLEHNLHLSPPESAILSGVTLLLLFVRLRWIQMQPWFCACVFIACRLVLQDNVLSNWGLLHPAGSQHGAEAHEVSAKTN